MRLTLRTLLAYRDGVLGPPDHQDMHRRIQQNGPVANLLRQINELLSRTDLVSPKLSASGMRDANVIAEYLDDSLTSDRVAELERLCLQHADHLCELAHCHQLLAEAMHTHVSVPESLESMALALSHPQEREAIRSRVLSRFGRKAAKSVAEGGVDRPSSSGDGLMHSQGSAVPNADVQVNVEAPMVASGGGTIRQVGLDLEGTTLASEIPEYLRASQRKRWKLPTAIFILLLLLGFIVWQSVGSLENLQQLWADPYSMNGAVPAIVPTKDSQQPVVSDREEPGRDVQTSTTTDDKETSKAEIHQATDSVDAPIGEREGTLSGEQESEIDKTDNGALQDSTLISNPPLPDMIDSGLDVPPDPQPDSQPEPGVETDILTGDTSEISTAIIGLEWAPREANEGRSVVFVRPTGSPWQLAGEGDHPIPEGRVVVPPSVRGRLHLGPWQWTTGGPGIVDFQVTEGQARITSSLFRGILHCTNTQYPLVVQTPAGNYRLHILAPSVWLALEISHRPSVRGSLIEESSCVPILTVVAFDENGDEKGALVSIASESGQELIIPQSGDGVAALRDQELIEFRLQRPPAWYRKQSIRLIDQEASQDYFDILQNRQIPIGDLIGQLVRHDRPELAALAIQSSLLLGNWRPMVSELMVADRLRAHWTSTIDLARQLALHDPARLANFEELLVEDFGEEGARRLLELFVGLRRDQQNSDGLAVLVKGLESESLAIRILSSYELAQLTGSDNGYLPHAPVKNTIQQIRRLLTTNKLIVHPVPDPIWERTAVP